MPILRLCSACSMRDLPASIDGAAKFASVPSADDEIDVHGIVASKLTPPHQVAGDVQCAVESTRHDD